MWFSGFVNIILWQLFNSQWWHLFS